MCIYYIHVLRHQFRMKPFLAVCGSKFTSVCNQNGKSQQLPLWLYERVWEFSVSQCLSQCVNYVHCCVYIASNIYK